MTSRSELRGFLSRFVPAIIISSRAFDHLSDQWGRQFYVRFDWRARRLPRGRSFFIVPAARGDTEVFSS